MRLSVKELEVSNWQKVECYSWGYRTGGLKLANGRMLGIGVSYKELEDSN